MGEGAHRWLMVMSSSSAGWEQARIWYLKPMVIRSYSCAPTRSRQPGQRERERRTDLVHAGGAEAHDGGVGELVEDLPRRGGAVQLLRLEQLRDEVRREHRPHHILEDCTQRYDGPAVERRELGGGRACCACGAAGGAPLTDFSGGMFCALSRCGDTAGSAGADAGGHAHRERVWRRRWRRREPNLVQDVDHLAPEVQDEHRHAQQRHGGLERVTAKKPPLMTENTMLE